MFQVSASIRYLDGSLAGLTIPSGFRITTPDRSRAYSMSQWLSRVQRERDFIRAAVTGSRYEVVGDVAVVELPSA
jgi:hypothetical protein